MTATTVPITIVCPDWCSVGPDDHARDLWDMGGDCIHISSDVDVKDPSGYQEPLAETRFHASDSLCMTTSARPDGAESASPIVHINQCEHSVAQALALAKAIEALVAMYREAGGIE